MLSCKYRGWTIERFMFNGKEHYKAVRFGVSMNHRTLEGLEAMIRTRDNY